MDKNHPVAALFDLDGVILDTESQYTVFWKQQGEAHRPDMPHFEQRIKGMTLSQILTYFEAQPGLPERIQDELNQYETRMDYAYIAGVTDFILALRERDIRTAVVTSSNRMKMENVYTLKKAYSVLTDFVNNLPLAKSTKENLTGVSLNETLKSNLDYDASRTEAAIENSVNFIELLPALMTSTFIDRLLMPAKR